MPTKIQRLKPEAKESLIFRGHNMSRWETLDKGYCRSVCLDCGAACVVNDHPLPNGIDIGGNALAEHCKWINKKHD